MHSLRYVMIVVIEVDASLGPLSQHFRLRINNLPSPGFNKDPHKMPGRQGNVIDMPLAVAVFYFDWYAIIRPARMRYCNVTREGKQGA